MFLPEPFRVGAAVFICLLFSSIARECGSKNVYFFTTILGVWRPFKGEVQWNFFFGGGGEIRDAGDSRKVRAVVYCPFHVTLGRETVLTIRVWE